MQVHVLQHVPFEGLGNIEPWLEARNANITYTRFFESAALPDPHHLDLIIALGGPMSVNDEGELPWLIAEKHFIAEAIEHGAAVLGICLGAQLIASAKGARVYAALEKEIGWFPVSGTSTLPTTFNFPANAQVMHWHGETFDLPPGAINLASSVVCKNQAFQLGSQTIGLQFHLEMTRESVETIVRHCADELVEQRYVQTEQAIREAADNLYTDAQQLMVHLLEYLTGK